MVDDHLMESIKVYVPSGERSNFVNTALAAALETFKRKKAVEGILSFRSKHKLRLSTEEIIASKNHGRD